ncbi:PrsW family intramembrane metalloprotease [Streptomyces sp. RY43-2]|uniref:PrsW family intramembrane metalloprotease n=1 Tax=Streptomyces macrolidinus TaxID=2952607 RepID=A0ABT0Z6K0_9ACTN|nr:PrsW family intramembrane metalloprotease [Streptomyces macrolidinus]MCN9239383.1 PrsW family intramembrane metalloprotease [Streptomyces macrolidinus]
MTQSPPPGTPTARVQVPRQPPPRYPRIRAGLWKRSLWGGLLLWTLTAIVTYATNNTTLLPTVILLGSFLTPVTFVLWAYEQHGRDLGVNVILGCFLTGGTLGVLGASMMEYYLLHPSLWMFAGVGLIEEAAKLAALMFVLRRHTRLRGLRTGLVLGATVGFGFAALESSGYAFNAAVSMEGIDLHALLETEILRGILAPFGHGLWTAIAGAALLSLRRRNGRFSCTAPVITTYLGVSLLHALWNSAHGIAIWVSALMTGAQLDHSFFTQGQIPAPTPEQRQFFVFFSTGELIAVCLLGLLWVRSLTRRVPSWTDTP